MSNASPNGENFSPKFKTVRGHNDCRKIFRQKKNAHFAGAGKKLQLGMIAKLIPHSSFLTAFNPLPVTRRSNGDCQSSSSPDFGSLLVCAFPEKISSDIIADSLPATVA